MVGHRRRERGACSGRGGDQNLASGGALGGGAVLSGAVGGFLWCYKQVGENKKSATGAGCGSGGSVLGVWRTNNQKENAKNRTEKGDTATTPV